MMRIFVSIVSGLLLASAAFAKDDYCYKDSYGRGVGTIPKACSGGQDYDAGLCYKQCEQNYDGVGPVCWQHCPSGYKDTGALCHIDKPLTTTGGWRCKTRDKLGTCWLWVKDCPSGYTNAGIFCALDTPSVPAGYSGLTGLDLTKKSYGRGVGTVPKNCGDKQYDAGLCYTNCRSGYNGIGPVCWNRCPSGYSPCGAGCATSTTVCATVTADMVVSTISLAVNVATMGASGEAEAAAESAEEAGRMAKAIQDAKEAYAALKASPQYQMLQKTAQGIAYIAKMEKLATAQSNEEALRALAGFDPTGVSQVVSAYAHHICNR